MHLFQNIDTNRDPVTRINGSFADHCTFVMQSGINFFTKWTSWIRFILFIRLLLSDLALQDDCLLVYCAIAWLARVLLHMHPITVSSKSRF